MTSSEVCVVVVFAYAVMRIWTKTPRQLIAELSTEEGFITAKLG